MRYTQGGIGPPTTEVVKPADLTTEGVPAAEGEGAEPSITDGIIGITNFAKSVMDMLQTIDGIVGALVPAYHHDKRKKAAGKRTIIESKEETPEPAASPPADPAEAGRINELLDNVIEGEGDITLSELKAKIADGSIIKYVTELDIE